MKSCGAAATRWPSLVSGAAAAALQTVRRRVHVEQQQLHVGRGVIARRDGSSSSSGRRRRSGSRSSSSVAASMAQGGRLSPPPPADAESGFQCPRFPWGDTPEEEHYRRNGVINHKNFFTSARGTRLFTQLWTPASAPPRALVCMVHGYGNDISWTFQNTAILFVRMGYAAVALDLEGHGDSGGLRGFTPDLDAVAAECLEFFRLTKTRPEFAGVPHFLYGESLGGALCLLVHFLDPAGWDGAVLVAPMCKISENMRPPWPVAAVLTAIARFVPTWAVVPTADLVEKSVKDPRKKELAKCNPRRYAGKPRLGTVVELLRVTALLGTRLRDVSLPLLVIHGDADLVTDPAVSKALYAAARSQDKTLKLYSGMLHSLLQGETDENVAIVVRDIEEWLGQRVQRLSSAAPDAAHAAAGDRGGVILAES